MLAWTMAWASLDLPVEEPLDVMQRNAAAGDPSSQFNLALTYQEGNNVPKDPARALEWYRKAAAAGLSQAQFNLGILLAKGDGVARDEKEAARWFYAAAQNGFLEAQKRLIKDYTLGRGVEKSPAKALAWDMLARRTLELRYGVPAGSPPRPGAMRADGAVEVAGKDGKKEWLLVDGSRETIDDAGVRHIESKDGSHTTVQLDGSWKTLYPSGLTEEVTPQGRKTLCDAKGQMEILEPDGTRIEDGDGTDSSGKKVRVRDTFGLDGQRISHRVTSGNSTYEERADGTRSVETKVRRDDGVELILTEQVAEDGTLGKGKLRRADDGIGPKDAEIWAIHRTLHVRGGMAVDVLEKYSSVGFYSQEELRRVAETRPPLPLPFVIPASTPGPAPNVVRIVSAGGSLTIPGGGLGTARSNFDDPAAFAPKTDLSAALQELAELEVEARNFAGTTEADYQRAQAAAAGYLIPLPVVPQKATNPPAWLREQMITQTTLHEFTLVPILDDRSRVVPFGPHGAELIRKGPWKHAETDHFIVHYRGDAEARLTMQYIEGVYTVLTQIMNLDPQRGPAKSHVFVLPESEWKAYVAVKSFPPQLAGFAYKTELFLGAAADRDDRAESIKVLCHEATHALVARYYPTRKPPLWMNEGLAEYIALRTMRSKGVASPKAGAAHRDEMMAQLTGKPDAVMDVTRVFTRVRYGSNTSPDRLAAFYANSQKCVQTLFEKLPVEGFAKFFNTLTAGNQPDVALAAAFGKQCDSVDSFTRLVNGL